MSSFEDTYRAEAIGAIEDVDAKTKRDIEQDDRWQAALDRRDRQYDRADHDWTRTAPGKAAK